ncbi:MAG: SUMF1/EgtB/PvdO family nonheme iron enzyme [Chromatiales bacterium]
MGRQALADRSGVSRGNYSPGETSSCRAENSWRTSTRGISRITTRARTLSWASVPWRPDYYARLAASERVARNLAGPSDSFDPGEPGLPKRVHRGGSFLCTDQYCSRYMVGTRGKGEITTGTNHPGFRCVKSVERASNLGAT